MSRLVLDYDSADKFVAKQQRLGNNVKWDGWTIVFWRPTNGGIFSAKGERRGDQWGIAERVNVSNDGKWRVNQKYVRSSR